MSSEKSHTLGYRMNILALITLSNLVAVWALSTWSASSIKRSLKEFSEVHVEAVKAQGLADMYHDDLRGIAYRALYVNQQNDASEKAGIAKELTEIGSNMKKQLSLLTALNLPSGVHNDVSEAVAHTDDYVHSVTLVVNSALEGKREAAYNEIPDMEKTFHTLEILLGKIGDEVSENADKATLEAHDELTFSSRVQLFLLLGGVSLTIVVSWWTRRNMISILSHLISRLSSEATVVEDSSTSVASASVQLQQSAEKQASALHETSSAIEEISAMVQKSASNATQSRDTATQSLNSAHEGRKAIDNMVHAIKEINASNEQIEKQIETSNQNISEIVRVINEIGQKTQVINDIVFQTKLLSFNASVEAARAGEHGKGFAVVAEEVGNLAQMSGNAASEISQMLNNSITKVEQIVSNTRTQVEKLVREGRTKVENGTSIASDCARILQNLVENAGEVSRRIEEISVASNEQSQGITEITRAIHDLNQTIQENVSSTGLTRNSAERLSEGTEQFISVVHSLQSLAGVGKADRKYQEPTRQPSRPTISSASRSISSKASPVVQLKSFSKPKAEPVVMLEDQLPAADDKRFREV